MYIFWVRSATEFLNASRAVSSSGAALERCRRSVRRSVRRRSPRRIMSAVFHSD